MFRCVGLRLGGFRASGIRALDIICRELMYVYRVAGIEGELAGQNHWGALINRCSRHSVVL